MVAGGFDFVALSLRETATSLTNVREVIGTRWWLPAAVLRVAKFLCSRYLTPLGQCLGEYLLAKAAMPAEPASTRVQ